MELSIFGLLALLFIKHWYIDFAHQSREEIMGKVNYGDISGIIHSFKHGIGTVIVMLMSAVNWPSAVILGILDFVTHYHIDWLKMKYGAIVTKDDNFWNHLGLDQLAHYLVYLFIVWTLV